MPEAQPGAVYTCPTHPEVQQVGPGGCPICSKALEPETVTRDHQPDPAFVDMTRRFSMSVALTLPIVVIDLGQHLSGSHWLDPQLSNLVQLTLATPVVAWAGWSFFVRGWNSVVSRDLNMFTLIALGTGVAWAYSLVAVVAPQLFPPALRDARGLVEVYFEAAAVITTLVLLGQVLELRARARTSGAIRALLGLRVRPGERVAVACTPRSRAPIQRLADQLAGRFVAALSAVALIAFAAWALFGPEPRLSYAMVATVTVLIIACPCALGLATPMSIMVGVRRGAQMGILIRDADALQRLETIDTLVIDKAGTLTEGRPKVVAVHASFGFDETETLRLAASVERASEHPLAHAIVTAAKQRNLGLGDVRDFESRTGRGARGSVGGRDVVVGNASYLSGHGVDAGSLKPAAQARREHGATVIFVGVDKRAAGLIAVADPIRPTTAEALRALSAEGIRLVMLTGDHAATAQAVARQLGIREVGAEALPEQKSRIVERLRASGRRVAMAGDGVNDAPALAAADVGIAMGGGTDAAIESAGVTLLRGDLRAIVAARNLSRATMRNIRQNLGFAFGYNAAGVPIAAGVLYPVAGILLSPMMGAAAMALSTVSVIANARRLARLKL
jgi:heavy metal translocating P-type ATPase